MACLSDIDLATLHRSRLEERFNYKLSFQQPHHIYEGGGGGGVYSTRRPCLPASMMPNNVGGCIKSTNLEDLNGHCAMDDLTKKLNRLKFLNKQKLLQRGESSSSLEEEEDYNYFSSTTRRRRSGTWP